MTKVRTLLVVALFATAGCFNPFEPRVPDNRRDPGTVIVQVRDTVGAPVPGVWVYIELPNSVGSTFWEGTATNGDGRVTHRYIPAGRRMLEVKPPRDLPPTPRSRRSKWSRTARRTQRLPCGASEMAV